MRRLAILSTLIAATSMLAGCELLGIESPEAATARREAEGKAVGGACRHAGRAIEDCYTLNKKADKSAVFAGWREMNDYMRENKIEAVAPQLPPPGQVAAKPPADGEAEADKAEGDKPSGGHGKAAAAGAKAGGGKHGA
jgi:hypothetical protein